MLSLVLHLLSGNVLHYYFSYSFSIATYGRGRKFPISLGVFTLNIGHNWVLWVCLFYCHIVSWQVDYSYSIFGEH